MLFRSLIARMVHASTLHVTNPKAFTSRREAGLLQRQDQIGAVVASFAAGLDQPTAT
jgi:hypothetical protein